MSLDTDQRSSQSHEAMASNDGRVLSNSEASASLPEYTQDPITSATEDDNVATQEAPLPPPYVPNVDALDPGLDPENDKMTGKTSGRYHGLKYSVDDLWKAAATGNTSVLHKCLKVGLNVNYCKWVKHDKTLGTGVRSIADIVACRNDAQTMRLLLSHTVDLSGAVVSNFAHNHRAEARATLGTRELELHDGDLWTTPLHEACKKGHVELVSVLLSEGNANPHTMDNRQRTGLFLATKSGHAGIVQLLLANGAAVESGNLGGITPLASAAFAGSADIVDILLRNGARVDAADEYGETALYNASLAGQHDIVAKLVAYGADVNARNLSGASAFFTAACRFKTETMSVLIECGADVDTRDENGCTPLLRAVMAKNVPLIRHLLDSGADIDASDDRGWTSLFAAIIHADTGLIHLLIEHGCNLSQPDLHGNTPLHQAAMLGSTTTVRHIVASRTIERIDHSQENLFGETPLALACKYNHIPIVKMLLKYGSDPRHVGSDDYRALDRAMYHGNYACVQHLLDAGAGLDDQTLKALQQGRRDHPSSTRYGMILTFLQNRHQVHSLPKTASSAQLPASFPLAVTLDELRVRMRMKQQKLGRTISTTQATSIAPKTVELSDPFEACIPESVIAPEVIRHAPHSGLATASAVRAGAEVGQLAVNLTTTVLGL